MTNLHRLRGPLPLHWASPLRTTRRSRGCLERRGKAQRSVDHFDEVPLLAGDDPLALGHGEVLERFWVRLQARSVDLVRRETLEPDQPPRHVVRAFVRKKVAEKMAAAAGNDAAPILGVRLERVSLERIDLVSDHARD